NAEYGQAQSGVVNIVTKDGGDTYGGSLSAFVGDYLTTDTDLFLNAGSVSPTAVYDLEGTLSGPIPGLRNRVTFFASGRYSDNEGHLFGRRIVQPISADESEGQFVNIDG